MTKKPESKLQRDTREALEDIIGGFWFKVHGGMFQRAGIPDLIGCVYGLYIGVELKTPEDKRGTSGVQKTVIKFIRQNGGKAFVAKSPAQAVDKVAKWLLKHGKITKDQAIRFSKEGSTFQPHKGKRRVVHGAGDWEDDYNSRDRSKAIPERLR